jgi:amino acid adenylation domain-containing protein
MRDRAMNSSSSTLNLANNVYLNGQTQPQATALVVDEQSYTYGEFAAAAARIATWLRARAPRHGGEMINGNQSAGGPRVGILAARSLETYAGIVGTAWSGGTYVPLNAKQPAARLSFTIERARLDALIVDAGGAARLFELGSLAPANVLKPQEWPELEKLPAAMPPTPVAPDHPAYIIFTSGTTGVPKGVVVTAANIAHMLACAAAMYHVAPHDRVWQFFETTFDPSVLEMFCCWAGGGGLYVIPQTKMMAPGGFIRQHGITITHAVPSLIQMMQRLKQLEPGALPSLRLSFFGGEGLPVASSRAWQAAAPNAIVENQYGPTEAAVMCISHRLADPPDETPGRGTLAIGRAFPGMYAAIVSEDDPPRFLPAGQTGELALAGPQLAAGYLGDEEQTARRFRMLDHPELGKTRWYLTGDSAYLDAQGLLHCLGRIDNQVKVLGHRVELEEIEAHLRAVCKTESVAAIAWPVVNGNPAGIVAFVSGGATAVDPAIDVREAMKHRVPIYMVPSRVHAIDALPLSTNGKVDRQGLRTMLDEKVVT